MANSTQYGAFVPNFILHAQYGIFHKNIRNFMKTICANCNVEFEKRKYQNRANKYCNKECYNKCKVGPAVFWKSATYDQKLKRLRFYFEKKVIKKDGCWDFKGAKIRGGYGTISVAGTNRAAHRISWWLHNGEIPRGLLVLHKCDNPICTNPEHLFLGTQRDNIKDCEIKNRRAPQYGENNPLSILNKEQVIEIRRLLENGAKNKEISERFKIATSTVSCIKHRRNWRNV